MRNLAIYLLYAATALRGALQVAERRDPTITIFLLAAYGALLFTEPALGRRLSSHSQRALRNYHILYILVQIGLILGMVLPGPTPDTFLALFFPLAYQAVAFFGWQAGRWWVISFFAPMLAYALRHPDLNNFIMAPIYEGASLLLGALAWLVQRAEAAREENLRMAQDLRHAQNELEKYADQLEDLAAERARLNLARELHDSVTQTVFSMNLAVEAARLMLPQGPAPTAAQLDRVQSLARNALGEIGRLVNQLQPQPDEIQDLVSFVKKLVARYQSLDELRIDLLIEGAAPDLPAQLSSRLCNIIQEALANIRKHAGTSQASIRIHLTGNPAWIEIEDCGSGFDLQSALDKPGHLGLVEMGEQAREVGWRLCIDSQPGRGTLLHLEDAREAAA